jgi:3-methyladenine DNA glycosylase Mpg
LGVTRAHNGLPLDRRPLFLAGGRAVRRIETSARIGVAYAGDWANAPLRFFEAGNVHVSGGRSSH